MRNKVALGFLALAAWLISAASAWAVSLGKIDIASHLGEPFYAEVPLQLDPGESISNVYVELASPADYRILEVYRDPALNNITVDVKTDKRGARVVLNSDSGIESPFFNLVLKVRYERATHFKKYPVFLDIPQTARPSTMKAIPTIKEGQRQVPILTPQAPPSVAPVVVSAKPAKPLPGTSFKPFDGWARIARYGPMVYGDTITTVAQRLRIDNRYTRQQVMVALFEKNRPKFDHDNINLIQAGTYLDVPTAAEVERISPEQARDILARQERVWKQLIKQPKYAAVAEAQRTRYSKRVRVGEKASGVAAEPMASQSEGAAQGAAVQGVRKGADNAALMQKQAEMQQQLQQLQQQNSQLQSKLTATQKQLAEASAKPSGEAAAAADANKIKKLQIRLARLQAERDEALQKAKAQPLPFGFSWLTYGLFGVIVLLLAVIGFLMRREPTHPAAEYAMSEPKPGPESSTYTPPSPDMSDMFEEAPEIDVEEVPPVDTTATMKMDAADVTKEFVNSIPDLTDEDTGKMEAFEGEIEEEPDANVDYLAEADVYLRYGMEDEAVQQVKMALKLDPHNADAHIKLAQVLKAKNDQAALDEAIAEARQSLGGSALSSFEEAVANLDQMSADTSFADTLPPSMAEEPVEFPDMETPAETLAEEIPSEAPAEAESAGGELEGLDLEWPEFEEEETPLHEAEAEAKVSQQEAEAVPEAPEPSAEESETPAPAAETAGGDMGFDLSDLEIPEADIQAAGEEATSRMSTFTDTSDLEKTVAIDWSQETSVEDEDQGEMLSESGSDAFGEAAPGGVEPEVHAEEEQKAEVPSASKPTVDEGIDLGDFDFDQAEAEKDTTVGTGDDEFSSTIRTTLTNIPAQSDEGEEELAFDLSSESEATMEISGDEPAASEPAKEDEEEASASESNAGGILLDIDEDMDQTYKLDTLLSELSDENDKDGDDKKD